MAIEIVVKGKEPGEEQIKGKCRNCSTTVNMLVEDLQQTRPGSMHKFWVCPLCIYSNFEWDKGHWPKPMAEQLAEQFGR